MNDARRTARLAHLSPFIVPVAILGKGSLTLWLLVKGVQVP